MKVTLVDNLVLPEAGTLAELDVHPHLGLLALAAVAEQAAHAVAIFDPKRLIRSGQLPHDGRMYGQAADLILATNPEIVGFTALGCSFLFAANVAQHLKVARPDLPILLGGPHATVLDRAILEAFPQFDLIVRHEADQTFPLVLDRLTQGVFHDIPGITWRGPTGSILANEGRPKIDDLDTLPVAKYDHYPVDDLDLDLLRIEAGRGCPFACEFCSTAGFFQRSFRLKSAERLVFELDTLQARYGTSSFKLDHDMFTANRKKVIAFCHAVRGRGYAWSASARVDCVDDALLAIMAEAGCVALYFGIETGSVRMQRITAKHLDLALVLPTLASAHALGIATTASFITGFPDELADDLAETLDYAGRCASQAGCLTQLHLLAPEPGTPLFDRHGDTIRYDGIAGPYHAAVLTPSDRGLILRFPKIFQTYYHYPTPLPRLQHRFAVAMVDIMRRLGPLLTGYTLRFFEGRLSCLTAAVEQSRPTWSDGPAPADFLDFLQGRFGRRHHLHSLCRYAFAAAAATSGRGASTDPFDPERSYVLAPGVAVLEEMHRCETLLKGIGQLQPGAVLEMSHGAPDSTYLMVPSQAGVHGYLVPPDLGVLTNVFTAPLQPIRLALGRQQFNFDAVAQLAGIGAIVPVATRDGRTPYVAAYVAEECV